MKVYLSSFVNLNMGLNFGYCIVVLSNIDLLFCEVKYTQTLS